MRTTTMAVLVALACVACGPRDDRDAQELAAVRAELADAGYYAPTDPPNPANQLPVPAMPGVDDAGGGDADDAAPETGGDEVPSCPCVDTHQSGTSACSMGVEWHCGAGPRNPATIPACASVAGGCIQSGASNGAWCCDS